jgi:hypothetical protein
MFSVRIVVVSVPPMIVLKFSWVTAEKTWRSFADISSWVMFLANRSGVALS